jgi:hypothetical protein
LTAGHGPTSHHGSSCGLVSRSGGCSASSADRHGPGRAPAGVRKQLSRHCTRGRGAGRRTRAPALNSGANCATLPVNPEADGIAPGPGPAASLWVAERTNNEILEVTQDLSTHDHPLPHPDSNPTGITLGPDGALWFTEILGNRIGRITTGGAITEYDLPHPNSDPFGITQGPDGALCFTEYAGNRIGRINPVDGKITEFTVPTSNAGAHGIVTGPDGALWFTEEFSGKIGRLAVAKPPPPQPSANIALSTPTPLAGRLLTLDPSASVPGTGSITRFAYDFNGSGTFQAICPPNEPIAYTIFDTPGSHVIGMRVTDSAGTVATTRVTVTVAGSRGRIRARTAANPAVAAVSHFWCGDRASLQAGNTAYLPLGFTSEVHAVGIDVTQGAVPDPPRPSALSRIAATSAVAFTHGARRGPRDARTYLLNNDKQDPRTHRITWLQRFGTTVVRGYASALIAPNGTNVPNVQMKLYGFRDGHLLPGSPLVSQTGPLDVPPGPPFTTHAMRVGYSPVDGALPAFTYTLPHDWVSSPGNVAFLAVPSLVGRRLDRQCATLECKLAEQASSGDFQSSDTGLYIVRTVAMTAKGDPALPDPFTVFDQAANITPVAVLPTPYQGTIDITPITTCKAGDTTQPCTDPNTWVTTQIGNWLANNQPVIPATVKVATIGVHKNHGGAQGYSSWPNPCSDNASGGAICETSNNSPVSQVEANRPLTSVAHEMLHDLGRPYADDSSSGCGGTGEGKPDSKGDTLAIGLDRHPGSGGSITNPYQILSPGLPGQQSSIYDPMSYCADNNPEDNTWISAHNWDQIAGEWIFFLKRAAQSSVRQAMAAVAAGPAVGPGDRRHRGHAHVHHPDRARRSLRRTRRGSTAQLARACRRPQCGGHGRWRHAAHRHHGTSRLRYDRYAVNPGDLLQRDRPGDGCRRASDRPARRGCRNASAQQARSRRHAAGAAQWHDRQGTHRHRALARVRCRPRRADTLRRLLARRRPPLAHRVHRAELTADGRAPEPLLHRLSECPRPDPGQRRIQRGDGRL